MTTTNRPRRTDGIIRSGTPAAGLRLAAPLLAFSLAIACPALAGDAGAPAGDEAATELVTSVRELLAPLGGATGPTSEIVAARLAALGPDAVPVLFEVASNGFAGPGGDARREAVHAAFRRLPDDLVLAHLRSVATGDEAGLAPRLRAMEVISSAGGNGALPLLLDVVAGIPARQMKSQAVIARLRPALVALLQADEKGYRTLEQGWTTQDPALREIAMDAIESIGRRASVRSLGRLLGREESTDLSLLRRLGRMPLTGPDELGDSARFELERLLGHETAGTRRAAAHLVGRFRHVRAVNDLLKLLDDEDRGVRITAAGSLRTLTGLSLGDGEAARWRAFVAQERAWRTEESAGILRNVQSSDAAVRLVAVRSLAQHRLHAEALWQPVAACLEQSDADLRAAACHTLGSLRTPAALGRLVEALADREPAVAEAAQAALVESTGRTGPTDADGWTSLLDLDRGIWD